MSFYYTIGVDVGTESVRCCLVKFEQKSNKTIGKVIISLNETITVYHPHRLYAEQSSEEIWKNIKKIITSCIDLKKIDTNLIKGIAFSATCSLCLVGTKLNTGKDIIMWMDHRSVQIVDEINKEKHSILKQFGNCCSPEFSLSKIIWLKKHAYKVYKQTKLFLELPCLLTFNCIKDDLSNFSLFKQSICSSVCKYGYNSETNQWPFDFFEKFGLYDIKEKLCEKSILPGCFLGKMSSNVCNELKILSRDVSISTSIIDAYAGVLGMLILYKIYLKKNNRIQKNFDNLLTMISGTSSCAMVLNKEKKFTNNIWGPYYNVILNKYYVREAGQSCAGRLIDFIINTHKERKTLYAHLTKNEIIKELNEKIIQKRLILKQKLNQSSVKFLNELVINELHVNPDFYGNRSPLANYNLRGCIYGLELNQLKLVDIYEAIVESLAYQMKNIVEELKLDQTKLKCIVSGGLTNNKLYMQIHSDVLNCELISVNTAQVDMMLVGTSFLARQAYLGNNLDLDQFDDVHFENVIFESYKPENLFQNYYVKKYKCYKKLVQCCVEITNIMKNNLD